MHPDLAKATQIIDQRISELTSQLTALQAARSVLAQIFEEQQQEVKTAEANVNAGIQRFPRLPEPAAAGVGNNGHQRINRKDQVGQFIQEHGPATRSEILAGTNIPTGTVAYCLNDQERFVNRNGKWHLVQ